MATYTNVTPYDASTFPHFMVWASAYGTALGNFGWIQGNDTGQVVWVQTSINISQVAVVGPVATYTYDGTAVTGPALRIGMSLTIGGFTNGGNNVTATINALGGSGVSSTFAVTFTTQVNETHAATGTTTALSSAPTTAATAVYEVWHMADSLQSSAPVYMILYYYAQGGSTPQLDIWVTHGTNGNGVPNGAYVILPTLNFNFNNSGSNITFFFSGDTNRFLYFNDPSQSYQRSGSFFIERSKDSSGNDTANYVVVAGWQYSRGLQQTFFQNGSYMPNEPHWTGVFPSYPGSGGGAGVGTYLALSPVLPMIGGLGNPCLSVLIFDQNDFATNTSMTVNVYGVNHTYYNWWETNATSG